MSVTEVKQAIGNWNLKLKEETPVTLLDQLTYYGHIALLPGQVDVAQYGDNLLDAARYVGVLRGRDQQDSFKLKGSGMVFWLGDEDNKGDVFETAIELNAQTFANTIRALLPSGGAITEGTLYSVAGTYTGRHQWQTPREAITYVADLFGAEFRVNNDGTLDAGPISSLYITVPKTLILPKGFGSDLFREVIPGEQSMGIDVEDTTTRVVLLAQGEGTNIATGVANAPATPYKDLHGNPIKATRLVSESGTEAGNATARAQLQLNRFLNPRRAVNLSTSEYDVKGTFVVGDYIDVYDPVNGFYDESREIYWQGERINPMALRCVEMTWPIPPGWTVAFRDVNGNWFDLTQYYVPETGDTTIVVGDLARGLASVGGEPVGVRPNLPDSDTPSTDTTIPAAPVFTSFSTGIYESTDRSLAAIQMTWDQPLNTDGSTITDGSHYEIRYRPNAIIGAPVSWDILSGEYDVDGEDTFSIDATDSWPGWTAVATAAAELDVAGGEATIRHPSFNIIRGATFTGHSYVNVEILGSHRIDYQPTGASTVMGVRGRYNTTTSDHYWGRAEVDTDGGVTAKLSKRKSGVETELGVLKLPGVTHTPNTSEYWTKLTLNGDVVALKVWQGTIDDEPQADTFTVWDQDPVLSTGAVSLTDWVVNGATNPTNILTRHSYFRVRDLAPDDPVAAYSWDDLGTWDAPTSEPVSVSPNWSIAYVGWDQTTYTLTELGAGIKYEIQIRAVDTASPPHFSAWSPSSFVDTAGDVIAPSTPAPPLVAASMIAVQIEHRLGKASGGTFNLEQDLSRLEIHASHTPTFFPSNLTKVGDLIATGAMVRGGIPAVGMFKVDQATEVWIRVVAVDRMGNSSAPSEAVQSSVELIDDAHIASLSVSKLTAGTITAATVLAAEMEVGPGGNIKITDGSLDVYDNLGQKKVEAGFLDNGEYDLAAIDPDTGQLVALSTLAFGMEADTYSGAYSPTTGNYEAFSGRPIVTTRIGSSGRVMFLINATFNVDTFAADGIRASVFGSGPFGATYGPSLGVSILNGITISGGAQFLGGTLTLSAGAADFASGLAEGAWTFDVRVLSLNGSPEITQAALIVMPF